jgi:histidinol phosphatase-like enzyme (inositol monophosphatase family)
MLHDLSRRVDIAAQAAWDAGKATLRWFQASPDVEWKADRSPVTAADRESERILTAILSREFPGDAFLGEETGARPGSSGWRWIVDPLDGTKSFIQGVPLYGVLVGLEDPAGEIVGGVVCLPALGELITAARGDGCRWNGRRARVSDVDALAAACVSFTALETFDASRTGTLGSIRERCRIVRGWGDCYGHILVATGRAEVMLDPVLSEWDCAALVPILEEAGGTFTDWTWRRTSRGGSGISTNGRVAAELRALLGAG